MRQVSLASTAAHSYRQSLSSKVGTVLVLATNISLHSSKLEIRIAVLSCFKIESIECVFVLDGPALVDVGIIIGGGGGGGCCCIPNTAVHLVVAVVVCLQVQYLVAS